MLFGSSAYTKEINLSCELSKYIEINCNQSNRMIKIASSIGIKNFTVTGSAFEYGESSNNYLYIPTNAPLVPIGSYPTSKVMSFYMFKELAEELNISISYERIFQVFGEGEAENRFWPALKKAALSGEDFPMTKGNQVRDFINVNDAANQLITKHKENLDLNTKFKVGHIANGQGQSLLSFAEYWWNYFKAKGKLLPGVKKSRPTDLKRIVAKV